MVEPGGTATFSCHSSYLLSSDGINGVQWLLNNTLLENFQLNNVNVALSDSGIGTVMFTSVSEGLNGTRIKCRIDHESLSEHNQLSNVASWLLIQGY